MKRRSKWLLVLLIFVLSLGCIKTVSFAYVENSSVAVINTFYASDTDDTDGGDDDDDDDSDKDKDKDGDDDSDKNKDGGDDDSDKNKDGDKDDNKKDDSSDLKKSTSDASGDQDESDDSSAETISNAKTGDDTNLMFWMLMLCTSVLILAQVVAWERGR